MELQVRRKVRLQLYCLCVCVCVCVCVSESVWGACSSYQTLDGPRFIVWSGGLEWRKKERKNPTSRRRETRKQFEEFFFLLLIYEIIIFQPFFFPFPCSGVWPMGTFLRVHFATTVSKFRWDDGSWRKGKKEEAITENQADGRILQSVERAKLVLLSGRGWISPRKYGHFRTGIVYCQPAMRGDWKILFPTEHVERDALLGKLELIWWCMFEWGRIQSKVVWKSMVKLFGDEISGQFWSSNSINEKPLRSIIIEGHVV